MVWWFWVLLLVWFSLTTGHVHVPAEELPQRRVFPVDRLILSARSERGRYIGMVSTRRWAEVVSIPLLYLLISEIGVKLFLPALLVSLFFLALHNLDNVKQVKFWFLEDLHVPLVATSILVWGIQRWLAGIADILIHLKEVL
jgi:hypothetical protein